MLIAMVIAIGRTGRRPVRPETRKTVPQLEALEPRIVLSAPFVLSPIVTFDGTTNGSRPASLIADPAGDLFGVTEGDTGADKGAVFEIPAGTSTLHIIHTFAGGAEGSQPNSLVIDTHGNLFGTTLSEGASGHGTLFEIPHGTTTLQTLAPFNAGFQANVASFVDSADNVFGVNVGTIYELVAGSGQITTVTASLSGQTITNLVEAPDGTIFGATQFSGANNDGTVFKIPAGTTAPVTIASFDGTNNGRTPVGVSLAANGDLFGVTRFGGANNVGTAFKVVKDSGTITVLNSFSSASGSEPVTPPLLNTSGGFYGVAATGGAGGFGTFYELNASDNSITDLVDLTNSEVAQSGGTFLASTSSSPGTNPTDPVCLCTSAGGLGHGSSPGGEGAIYGVSNNPLPPPPPPPPPPPTVNPPNPKDGKDPLKEAYKAFLDEVREETHKEERARLNEKNQVRAQSNLPAPFPQLRQMLAGISSDLKAATSQLNAATGSFNRYTATTKQITRLSAQLAKAKTAAARAKLQGQLSAAQSAQSAAATADTTDVNAASADLDTAAAAEATVQATLDTLPG